MIGTTLSNRYRIDSEISRGGLGIVYKGHDLVLDRDVAIKMITSNTLGAEGNTRLLQEARVIAQLNHPNIVTVYDFGEVNDSTFVVMELVEGHSLHDKPPKDLEELIAILQLVCAGLEYAHQQGIIHRDLKPENVMLSTEGGVRLMDFGLARSLSSRLTSEGAIIGTVFYMAPEQALGQVVDNRADLYALGVMLYELSTGRLPFTGDDPLAVITQHIHTSPVPPCAINPQIPLALEGLILQLMSKQPEDRPVSADEVLHRLENVWQEPTPASAEYQEELALARIARGRMIGRENELNEIVTVWKRVLLGHSDERVLLISGEPGIGKTRLVKEFMTHAAVEKAIVLHGECYPEEGAPYTVLAQIIRQVLSLPVVNNKNLLDNRILAELLTLTPELQVRFPDVVPNPKLDPQDEQQRLYDSVLEMMISLSQIAPVVLVIDDAHWADRATLALLRHLARRCKSMKLPMLVVATYREVELNEARPWLEVLSDLNRERLSFRLKLSRLDKQQTCQMLAILFNEEITPEFLDGIYYETEGNPFFVEEVVKTLVDDDIVYYKDGSWHRPSMKEIIIPQSVRIAIQTRLIALPDNVQEMLRMASILGREFDGNLIRNVFESDEDALISAIESAERAQFISEIESRQPGQVNYAFVHALIHATIYESVSGLRRQRMHRKAALAIESIRPTEFEALVFHYQEGGDLEQARKYAIKAGERALSLYANQDAVKYYKMALELGGSEVEKALTLTGLGQALYRESQYEEAVDCLKQAIPIYQKMKDFDQVAHTYAIVTHILRLMTDIETSIAFGEEGLELISDQPSSKGKIALMRIIGNGMMLRGWNEKAITRYRQALNEANQIGDIEEQAETLIRLGFGLCTTTQGDRKEGFQMLQEALKLAESSNLLVAAETANSYMSQIYKELGDLPAAVRHNEMAVQLSRQIGMAQSELFNLNWTYYLQILQGNFRESGQVVKRGRYLAELIDYSGPAGLGFNLVEAFNLYVNGEITKAREILYNTYHQAYQAHNINWAVISAQFLIECLINDQNWAEAEAVSMEVMQSKEQERVVIIYYLSIIIYSHLEKIDEAHKILEKATTFDSDQMVNYWERFYFYTAQGSLACAELRWNDAWQHFDAARQDIIRIGYPWYEAFLLRYWAEALLVHNEPGDHVSAQEFLEQAKGLYQKMSLPAWVKFIEERIGEI